MHNSVKKPNDKVIIIGAGPAGLTAAYQLCKLRKESIVLEKDRIVGGIARTVNYKNYLFDIGGHRFFTKIHEAKHMWQEVLQENLLHRKRLSRIYYNNKYFFYPIRFLNALSGLGIYNSSMIILSYIHAHIFPYKNEETFEQWITNRFGKRLYDIFFKSYTEKVWGIPCNEIRAEWAAQRIKGLSLRSAVKNAFMKPYKKNNGHIAKTLIDSFDYPKLGPGMMWQTVSNIIQQNGSIVHLDCEVEAIVLDKKKKRVDSIEVRTNGEKELFHGKDFISTMPIRELVQKMRPSVPGEVLEAANNLNYRDFLTVALIVNQPNLFPDNWIYIHDPLVKLGRVQNFKNWSPDMVSDQNKSCLGLEYFCFEGDELWNMKEEDLIEFGKKELEAIGLVKSSDIEDGSVVRMPKAYPAYDTKYREMLNIVRQYLKGIRNLQLIGRNGLHRYNNQDHSMLTAMLAVENIHGANHDLWSVNEEKEYHEDSKHSD